VKYSEISEDRLKDLSIELEMIRDTLSHAYNADDKDVLFVALIAKAIAMNEKEFRHWYRLTMGQDL